MGALSRVQVGLLPFVLGFLVAVMTNVVWMPAVNGFIGKLFPDAKSAKAVRTAPGPGPSDSSDDESVFGLHEVKNASDVSGDDPKTSFIRNKTFDEVKKFAALPDVSHAVYIALNDGCGHCMQFKESGAMAELITALGSITGHIVHVNDGKGGVPYPDQVTYLPFIGVVDAQGNIREIKADRNDFKSVCYEVDSGTDGTDGLRHRVDARREDTNRESNARREAAFAARTKPGYNGAVPL